MHEHHLFIVPAGHPGESWLEADSPGDDSNALARDAVVDEGRERRLPHTEMLELDRLREALE